MNKSLILSLTLLGACEAGPDGSTLGDWAATPSSTEDTAALPILCDESAVAVGEDDASLGFNASDVLDAAVMPPVSSVSWSVQTADVAAEAAALSCDLERPAVYIVTRTNLGEPGEADCPEGPELRVEVTCQLNIGEGGITGGGPTTFQGSALDSLVVLTLLDDVTLTAERAAAASGDSTVDHVSALVLGDVDDAEVRIDAYATSATGDPIVQSAWRGNLIRE